MNFPHTATIQSNIKTGSKYITTTSATCPCFLQPVSDSMSQAYGDTFTKTFYCYLPHTAPVEEKMRLIIDGISYGVNGLKTYNYGTKHKRATLTRL